MELDYDGGLIYLIIDGGVDAFNQVKRMGVTKEHVKGNAGIAFDFLFQYFEQYKQLPGLEFVVKRFGRDFKSIDTTLEYTVQHIMKRHLYELEVSGIDQIIQALETHDSELVRKLINELYEKLNEVSTDKAYKLKSMFQELDVVLDQYHATQRGESGIELPWPTLNGWCMGLQPGTLTYFLGKPSTGKCIDGDTLILCGDGVYRTISDVVERKSDTVYTCDLYNKIYIIKPSDYIFSGIKNCVELTLLSGKKVTCTPEHWFAFSDGNSISWVPLENLKRGDKIAMVDRSYTKITWDSIVNYHAVGCRRVYDLSIPDTHCFIANDIVVHNSWASIIIASYAWLKGHSVLLVSPEMRISEIQERFLAINTELSYKNMVSGELGTPGEEFLKQRIQELKTLNYDGLWVMDEIEDMNPSRIQAAIHDYNPELIVLDSCYDIQMEKGLTRIENMPLLSKWMRELGKSTKRPIIAMSQLTDDNLAALSRQTKWDANNVIEMEQTQDMLDDKIMKLIPKKVRRGAKIEALTVFWDFDQMRWHELNAKPADSFNDFVNVNAKQGSNDWI